MSLFILLMSMQTHVLATNDNINTNVFDYKTIQGYSLGDVAKFGIFANTYKIGGTIHSNFAAETFVRESIHTIGTDTGKGDSFIYIGAFEELTNAGNNSDWVGSMNLNSAVSLMSLGEKYTIEKKSDGKYYINVPSSNVQHKVSDHEIVLLENSNHAFDVKMQQSFDRLETIARNYMQLESTGSTIFDNSNWDENSEGVTLEEGSNVFHIDIDKLTETQDRSFTFNNISQASQVVINVDIPNNYSDTINFKKNMGNLSSNSADVGKILWNFGDYDGTINIGSMRGTLLAPRARINGSSSTTVGTLIGDYVYTEGTHYKNDFAGSDFEFVIPIFDHNAVFSMEKTISGLNEENKLIMDLNNPENNVIDISYAINFENIAASLVQEAKAKEIVLLVDTSGSMEWSINGGKDDIHINNQRLTIAKNAAKLFIDSVAQDENTSVGIVNFSSRGENKSNLVNVAQKIHNDNLKSAIDGLSAGGGTNVGDGLRLAKNMLNNGNDAEKYIVFLGDGKPTGFSYSAYSPSIHNNKNKNNVSFYKDIPQPSRANLYVESLDNVSYFTGSGVTSNVLINPGSIDHNNYASEYAKLMSSSLDGSGVRGYYIGFTNDGDVQGLLLEDDVRYSKFTTAATADELNEVYQEIADEIISSVYLQNFVFDETFPEGIKIESVSFGSQEYETRQPEVYDIYEEDQRLKAEFGNIIYELSEDGTVYEADPISFTVRAKVEEAKEYVIGADNSSALHYTDFDASEGEKYFEPIPFKAIMMNTDNRLTIVTDPAPMNSDADTPMIIMPAKSKIVGSKSNAFYPLNVTIKSENFEVDKVYVRYDATESSTEDLFDAEGKIKDSNDESWKKAYPESSESNLDSNSESDDDSMIGEPGFKAQSPEDSSSGEEDKDDEEIIPDVEGTLKIKDSGYYTIYAEDEHGNFIEETYRVILPEDLKGII